MKNALLTLLLLGILQYVEARPPKGHKKHPAHVTYRTDCQPGTSQVDLDINNVRARLLSRGDLWWDYNNPAYEVPKGSGLSTIGAGAIWMGGYDEFGNLKLAATTYADQAQTDYYPGPLDANGSTDAGTCSLWDKKFIVYGEEINQFRTAWKTSTENGVPLYDYQIPDNIKAYPGRGNPFYTNGFDLPDQILAPFYDQNEDGIYNPYEGDFPRLLGRGLGNYALLYADKMIFQIFNDNGGLHANTLASALKVETQLMSFAFNSEDFMKNVTFESYRLIYKGSEPIFDSYFSFWVDGDIGCSEDDFVGVDTTRDLVYFYNASNVDGNCGSSYGTNIPIQGVKLLRGPLDNGDELGLTSFIYYNNSTNSSVPSGTTDPETALEYYNYMSGAWKDGSPLYGSKAGYQQPFAPIVKFAFPSAPSDPSGWSMAQENLEGRDLRGVLSSGPFKLQPGITNEFIISLTTVLNVNHPKPKIKELQELDSLIDYFLLNHGCFLANSAVQDVDLFLFPNPATDYIHIQSSKSLQTVNFQLINMAGQVVLSQKVNPNEDISIRHLPQGIYGYQMQDRKGENIGNGKLVIK